MMDHARNKSASTPDRHLLLQDGPLPISFVSNSRLLNDGLALLLREHLEFQLLGTYSAALDTGANLDNPAAHIVLLDTQIGQDRTLDWLQYWRSRQPPACVLLLEMCHDVELLLAYIEAGASGFTLCGASPAQVAEMIQLAIQGYAACPPNIIVHLFERLAALNSHVVHVTDCDSPLTKRELEVLSYIAQGHSNKQIAETLVVTTRTVKFHVHNILEKLNRSNRHEAAKVALERGWVRA